MNGLTGRLAGRQSDGKTARQVGKRTNILNAVTCHLDKPNIPTKTGTTNISILVCCCSVVASVIVSNRYLPVCPTVIFFLCFYSALRKSVFAMVPYSLYSTLHLTRAQWAFWDAGTDCERNIFLAGVSHLQHTHTDRLTLHQSHTHLHCQTITQTTTQAHPFDTFPNTITLVI